MSGVETASRDAPGPTSGLGEQLIVARVDSSRLFRTIDR